MDIKELQSAVRSAYSSLEIDALSVEREELAKKIASPDFWLDNESAQKISKKHSELDQRIVFWTNLKNSVDDLLELDSLNDPELNEDILASYTKLSEDFKKARRELQFSGQYDDHDVLMSIYAGTGGTDAQDWAQMLLRMYTRYAEANGIKYSTIEQSVGEEAGIKSVTIALTGKPFLFGMLKSEHGVHRLVRLSPFNADSLRQTSFAKVDILPKVDAPDEMTIDQKDLKIDVFRSGGHGGQSVNTTDSAVRITHIPTGIVVVIQNERSQLQNRETAMTVLRSKLAQLQIEQHKETINDIKGPNEQASWGNQIRNYVLHPYTMVKDTRTKYETTDALSVLGGDIDEFIEAYLDTTLSAKQ